MIENKAEQTFVIKEELEREITVFLSQIDLVGFLHAHFEILGKNLTKLRKYSFLNKKITYIVCTY